MRNDLVRKLLQDGSSGPKFKGPARHSGEVGAAGHMASAVGKQRFEYECSARFSLLMQPRTRLKVGLSAARKPSTGISIAG